LTASTRFAGRARRKEEIDKPEIRTETHKGCRMSARCFYIYRRVHFPRSHKDRKWTHPRQKLSSSHRAHRHHPRPRHHRQPHPLRQNRGFAGSRDRSSVVHRLLDETNLNSSFVWGIGETLTQLVEITPHVHACSLRTCERHENLTMVNAILLFLLVGVRLSAGRGQLGQIVNC
jgi:hypothetical protein